MKNILVTVSSFLRQIPTGIGIDMGTNLCLSLFLSRHISLAAARRSMIKMGPSERANGESGDGGSLSAARMQSHFEAAAAADQAMC